jgi:hypothetical protein
MEAKKVYSQPKSAPDLPGSPPQMKFVKNEAPIVLCTAQGHQWSFYVGERMSDDTIVSHMLTVFGKCTDLICQIIAGPFLRRDTSDITGIFSIINALAELARYGNTVHRKWVEYLIAGKVAMTELDVSKMP